MKDNSVQNLREIGEFFIAGMMEFPEGSVVKRVCRAFRRYYENCPMTYVEGSLLYPSGRINPGTCTVFPHYWTSYAMDSRAFEKKCEDPTAKEILREFIEYDRAHPTPGHNHSTLNYKRILAEGVNSYEKRVMAMNDGDLKDGLMDALIGIRSYHSRSLAYLRDINADEKLIRALEKVPFEPAETAYEALVCCNFMMYLERCDNIGRVDSWLLPYWKGENLVDIMHRMMMNLQDNTGWSIALGPDYSDLTRQWLEASSGLARPLVELRVTEDMPDALWEVAIEKVLSGGGQPAFYNEKGIQAMLRDRLPDASAEDIKEFCGVGCTETSFAGMTCSGGIDINLNVLAIFEKHMQEELAHCATFDEFYAGFTRRLRAAQDGIIESLNEIYHNRAEKFFVPVRTLFVDDCIERQLSYNAGGARYSFAVPSDSGMPNTVDSLLAVKELVYDKKVYTPEEFLNLLQKEEPVFRERLLQCPCYGVGNSEADALLHDLTQGFYEYYRNATLEMGFGIFPTGHQWLRHIGEGMGVGATPDGRRARQPVADSIAAVNGKAVCGPTSMLLSAAAGYAQNLVFGMPVTNLSITKKYDPKVLRALIEGYFAMGGMQLQITCSTKETLLAAKADPDSYRDLIVRVGGFSEYFRNLDEGTKDAVIARTMFEN